MHGDFLFGPWSAWKARPTTQTQDKPLEMEQLENMISSFGIVFQWVVFGSVWLVGVGEKAKQPDGTCTICLDSGVFFGGSLEHFNPHQLLMTRHLAAVRVSITRQGLTMPSSHRPPFDTFKMF